MEKLIQAIRYAEEQAESPTLQEERQKALQYYNGDPLGNEVEGRSQFVSRDVHDTVEWIKPSLLKMFASGDDVVSFNPVGEEDVDAAEQETEFVNHVFMQKNDGFMILHDWFHDGLLLKNAYVRVYWDDKEELETETYSGLIPEQVAIVMQDPSAEIVGQGLDESGITIKVQRKKNYGYAKVECLIPENCRVSHSCNSVDVADADFFQYAEWKTISDLRLAGFKVDDDINDGETYSYEEALRNKESDQLNYGDDTGNNDPSMRRVKVKTNWIRFDKNNDGKAELIYAINVGNELLHEEECDLIPIAAISPCPQPHRHNGNSVADSVYDLQELKTALIRGYLDNLYLANNGRYAIDANSVNLSDMLQSRPGGIVRVQGAPGNAIQPLVHPQIGASALQGIEYVDSVKENRTGVTRYNQGIDANSLNKTASGITQIMSASQQRIELIARIFATGVKRMFWIIHKLTKQHSTQADVIRLGNKYIPVDPRTWKTRNDMTISVGLGTGNKDQMLVHLNTIIGMQAQGMQIGVATPKNIYEAAKALTLNAGFKDVDRFWTDPSEQPPQPPQPNPEMMKVQQQAQADQAKLQLEQQKAQADIALKQNSAQADMALEVWKAQQEAELEKYKAGLKAQSEYELQQAKIQLQAHSDMAKAEMEQQRASIQQMHDIQISRAEADDAKEAAREDREMKLLQSFASLAEKLSKPKKVVRDKNGRVSGVE